MFKLRNISLSNIIFKKNNLTDVAKYLPTSNLTSFSFSTNNDSDKNKNNKLKQPINKSNEPAGKLKKIIVMKKAENVAPNVSRQQQPKKAPETKATQAEAPIVMKQEPKITPPSKTPVVMKKKEEPKAKPRAITITKDLSYKEVIQTQESENYKYLFNNAAIVKLMREYSNLYSDTLEKKYNKVLKEIIREKVFSIENEINSMKEIFAKIKDTKINFDELKNINTNINRSEASTILDKSEFKNIFDLSKNSLKDIKEKIKALPQNKTESLSFNIEYSAFYLNVDIDKSFEIFKEKIAGKNIKNDLKTAVEDFAENFLLRIYELDRLIYLPHVLKFIESNKLSINASLKLLEQISLNTQNHSNSEGFNYNALLLNLRLLDLLLTYKSEKSSKNVNLKINEIFENSISQITSFKLSNKIIHKEIESDEILSLSSLLASSVNSSPKSNQNSIESLHKIFALYFDNKDFLPLINSKLLIHSLNNNDVYSSILKTLKANLEAYLNNFGLLPNGFAESPVIKYYYDSFRPKLNSKDSTIITEEEVEFTYFLLKHNNLSELQADLISLLDASKAKSELVKSFYSDFILNNSLDQGKFYYENIEKIYSKNLHAHLEKDFANNLLFQTLAYLKDGNSDFAIRNLLQSIEKRVEFVRNNDNELIKLIDGLTNSKSLNAGENEDFTNEINIKLDADFVPFIEQIKQNIRDLLAYETAFKTQKNVLLAKENIIDKFFDVKSSNVNLNLDQDASDVANANSKTTDKSSNISLSERNFYNEKFNKIIYNLNQIKNLRETKQKNYLSTLNAKQTSNKTLSPLASNANISQENTVNKDLEEMKVFIYTRFEASEKFYYDISKTLRMSFNRVEDFENLQFESAEAKQNLTRNLDRKIRELSNYKNLHPENKELLHFYKSFLAYAESKPVSLSSEVILSEDMLNYIENPDFILKRKINEDEYVGKARDYFRDYYAKAQKRVPRQSLFVLENLDFLKNNLKVDLENYTIRNAQSSENDVNSLKGKIEYYTKNLQFVKQIIAKTPDFEIDSGSVVNSKYSNKNDLLLKKLILFEAQNSTNSSNNAIVGNDNKPNHLIEAYIKSFTSRVSQKLISNLSSGKAAKRTRYPYKAINDKNLFKLMFTLNKYNPGASNVLNSIAEKVIVPTINSSKIGVYKNVLGQLQNLEQSVKGKNHEQDFAVNELYSELLKRMNISFNKGTEQNAEDQKLTEMKDVMDQNFEVFDVKHCVYMIQFGVENNIAEAIRLGEKVCSDLGYSLPSHIENLVNKYLLTNGEDYARASEKIYPVDLARIYNNSKNLSINDSIESVYDEVLQSNSPYAVDKLPLKGLEKAFDFRKFSNVIRHFNLKH